MKNEETRESRLMYLLSTFYFTKQFDSLAEGGIINDENVSSRIENNSGDLFMFVYEILAEKFGTSDIDERLYGIIVDFLYSHGFADSIKESFIEKAKKATKFLIKLYDTYQNTSNKTEINTVLFSLVAIHFNSYEESQGLRRFNEKYLNMMSIKELKNMECSVLS